MEILYRSFLFDPDDPSRAIIYCSTQMHGLNKIKSNDALIRKKREKFDLR